MITKSVGLALGCWVLAACGNGSGAQITREPGATGEEPRPDPNARVTDLAAGSFRMCARMSDGTVRCWGQCGYECGAGPTDDPRIRTVAGLSRVRAIALGESHLCALHENGTVSCLGSNYAGALGVPAPEYSPAPVAVPGVRDAIAIEAGGDHTCVLTRAGGVICWGPDARLGMDQDAIRASGAPAPIAGVSGARAIEVSSARSCAIAGGGWQCWQTNGVRTPQPNTLLATAAEIDTDGCNCVRDTAGVVTCTGLGLPGPRPADGSEGYAPPLPCAIERATGFASIEQGGFVCGIGTDRSLRCWGELFHHGPDGAIRLEAREPTAIPIGTVTDVAVGSQFACALTTAGEVKCWGSSGEGQLDGTRRDQMVWPPVTVRL